MDSITVATTLDELRERVRYLESYAAQLLDQRYEALARRDHLEAELTALRAQMSTATAQTSAAVASIDRSLDTLSLETAVVVAADALAEAVDAARHEGHRGVPVEHLLASYRHARAALDEHECERELIADLAARTGGS